MATQRTFALEIAMENEAFQEGRDASEVASILRRIADRITQDGLTAGDWRHKHVDRYTRIAPAYVMDSNGNNVGGYFTFTKRERF